MRRKKAEMYNLVSVWEKSDETKVAFCQAHQINKHTFTYWHQKYKLEKLEKFKKGTSDKSSEKFVSLQVEKDFIEHIGSVGGIELSYPNGVRLRLEATPSVNYLSSLIQIVATNKI